MVHRKFDIPKSILEDHLEEGFTNQGDFLYAFSQPKEQFIAEWKDADLGL